MDSVALVLLHRRQFDEIAAVADLDVHGSCCAIDDLRGAHVEIVVDALNVDSAAPHYAQSKMMKTPEKNQRLHSLKWRV